MDPKRLMIAALVLIGLSGALWWSNKQEQKPAASPDDAPKVLEIPQDQINKIEIRRMGAEPVVLTKGAGWGIAAPVKLPADGDAVNAMVATLAVLTSERLVDEKAADFKPYGLAAPILSLVVGRADGKSHTLHLGDNAPSGAAAYARVEGEQRLFLVPSATRAALEKTWRDLRDKRLLPFDAEKVTRVELGAIAFGKNSGNAWTIVQPKALRADNFAAEELVRKLKDAKMEVTNDTEEEAGFPAKFAAGTPVGIAKVTDAKGTMQIEVRKGKENDYYARSSAVEGVFKTTAELGDGLAKKLDDFRNKKLFEFGFNQPDTVEVKQGGAVYAFKKSGSDWKRDGKTVEPGEVQQVVDRLRELTATGFADTGPGAIVAEYVVGKETVVVNQQGEKYFARRANEPEVYVLDGKAVSEIKDLAAAVKEPATTPTPAKK
ncbi:MAG: DUF4340 domain-containing protein [Bryobacterales bacterium]|nr:DUF4340 domain-containing protein [Bryobacterales bacterium]